MRINKHIIREFVTTLSIILSLTAVTESTYAAFEKKVNFELCYTSDTTPILASSFTIPGDFVAIWSSELTTYSGVYGFQKATISAQDSNATIQASLNALTDIYVLPDANYCTLYWGNEISVSEVNVSTFYENAANNQYEGYCFFMEGAGFDASTFTITSSSTAEESPVLSGYEGTYVTSVDNPVSSSYVKSLITAYDETDGNLTDAITISSDLYQGNEKIVGTYPIIFSVSDLAGNISSITIHISVVDCVKPIINGQNTYISYMSSPLTADGIKTNLTISDNYDSNLNNSIIISNDYFTGNENTIGTYSIEFSATDTAGNTGLFTINVEVVDDIKPLISGSASYVKSTTAELSLSTIKSGISINDNIDGNISSSLSVKSDTYSANCNKAGTYSIVFTASDLSGNIANDFVVKIVVEDKISPVFYVDSSIINTDVYTTLTKEQIITLLTQTGSIPLNNKGITVLSNEYEGNEKNPGTYNRKMKYNLEDNSEGTISVDIIVNQIQSTDKIDVHWYDIFIRIINVVIYIIFRSNDYFVM